MYAPVWKHTAKLNTVGNEIWNVKLSELVIKSIDLVIDIHVKLQSVKKQTQVIVVLHGWITIYPMAWSRPWESAFDQADN